MKKSILKSFKIMAFLSLTVPILKVNALDFIPNYKESAEMKKEMIKVNKEYFGEDYLAEIEANHKAAEKIEKMNSVFGENNLPDYVGGFYIDDDNNAVVEIVENQLLKANSKEKNAYSDMIDVAEDAKIIYVDYSYNQLKDTMDYLNGLFTDGKLNDLVTSFYLDTRNNRIVIGLIEYNQENIEKFKNDVLDSDMLSFSQGETYQYTEDLKSGGPLNLPLYNCSAGYIAKKSLYYGIVTAGHCVELNQQTLYGVVGNRQKGGQIDAAWINTTGTSYTPVNTLYSYSVSPSPTLGVSQFVANDSSFVSGLNVARVGRATGYQVGEIVDANYSVSIIDQGTIDTYTNLVLTTVYQLEGDSGGVVFTVDNHMTMGIGTISTVSDNQMIFSKANIINSTFGISRY